MKDELPDVYKKTSIKTDENKAESSEQSDVKAGGQEEKSVNEVELSAPPTEGNVSTAAAAALASAAVKAKVL